MHPNNYLRTFWRSEFTRNVFVAMSFSDPFKQRYEKIIKPAIEDVPYRGQNLKPIRVDLSQTGDSILTDIIDGIANSLLILADVSTIGNDSKTGESYRNGNVMYEVGIALACRQPTEVLLIRDDNDKFLFDVSVVPHKHLDFANTENARTLLAEEIKNRLREIDHVKDARINVAIATLTGNERTILALFKKYPMGKTFWLTKEYLSSQAAIPRLLDKRLFVTAGITHDGHAMYMWTELGRIVADHLDDLIPVIDFSSAKSNDENSKNDKA